ncbi:MAG TPA: sigma 54-interacting transcriptional regulator [Nitrospirae bacterium]|nr:sigma 54-interacting transcriptional regulator [Nitrospirota bacterium]
MHSKNGALDYLEKPVENINWKEVFLPFQSLSMDDSMSEYIIGKSKIMKEVFEIIKKASLTDTNVLITGDSGTGEKNLLQRQYTS